jgi:hypothetical protein
MRAKGMNLEKIRRIAVRCRTSYVAHRNSRYRIGSRAHEASHQRTTPRREANLAKDARQGQAEFNRRSWVARPLIEHPPQTQHSICGSRNRHWGDEQARSHAHSNQRAVIDLHLFRAFPGLTARAAPGRRTEPRRRRVQPPLPAPWSSDPSARRVSADAVKASTRLPPEPISARCGWPRRRSCPAATGRGSSARAA